jgi:hypothetical protein
MLRMPGYIDSAGVAGSPIKYKWNNSLALKYYATKDQNVKLYLTLDKSNFKAKMAIGLAVSEWIAWRFSGIVDLTDCLSRLEAGWASLIDTLYSKSLDVPPTNNPTFHDTEKAAGPILTSLRLLNGIHSRFVAGSVYLAEPIVKQAMLARYLMPEKSVFDLWLSSVVRESVTTFPRLANYDEESGVFDASHEKAIPREFFEQGYEYSEATASEALKELLRMLDPGLNPYLRTPEEMKAEGFKGTPYRLG